MKLGGFKMKNQKWLAALVLALTATVALSACTNDEEPCEEQVVVQACVG